MRFYRDVVIANWKLYPIPLSLCLKNNTLRNFWGLLKKPIIPKLDVYVHNSRKRCKRPHDLSPLQKNRKIYLLTLSVTPKIQHFSVRSYLMVLFNLETARGCTDPPNKYIFIHAQILSSPLGTKFYVFATFKAAFWYHFSAYWVFLWLLWFSLVSKGYLLADIDF